MLFLLNWNYLKKMDQKRFNVLINSYNTFQRLGGFNLFKKSAFSIKFVKEWLNYSSDKRIISDDENQCGKKNDICSKLA